MRRFTACEIHEVDSTSPALVEHEGDWDGNLDAPNVIAVFYMPYDEACEAAIGLTLRAAGYGDGGFN
jgi:hypothetical protein